MLCLYAGAAATLPSLDAAYPPSPNDANPNLDITNANDECLTMAKADHEPLSLDGTYVMAASQISLKSANPDDSYLIMGGATPPSPDCTYLGIGSLHDMPPDSAYTMASPISPDLKSANAGDAYLMMARATPPSPDGISPPSPNGTYLEIGSLHAAMPPDSAYNMASPISPDLKSANAGDTYLMMARATPPSADGISPPSPDCTYLGIGSLHDMPPDSAYTMDSPISPDLKSVANADDAYLMMARATHPSSDGTHLELGIPLSTLPNATSLMESPISPPDPLNIANADEAYVKIAGAAIDYSIDPIPRDAPPPPDSAYMAMSPVTNVDMTASQVKPSKVDETKF
jgi:hypothetical protein